jgi:hypothetical protein
LQGSLALAASFVVVCAGVFWWNRGTRYPSYDVLENAIIVSGEDTQIETIEIHFEGETDPCNILGPQFY